VERRTRFVALKRLARRRGHRVVLAGSVAQARRWGADGAYGPAAVVARGPALLRLATAHSLHEIRRATRSDALLLSPVFPTRSHPGGRVLGAVRFHLIEGHAQVPVIALGGMTARRARTHGIRRWAAIDGLATGQHHFTAPFPIHS
jgi:thiamine-phosphate pyrophosphorylase